MVCNRDRPAHADTMGRTKLSSDCRSAFPDRRNRNTRFAWFKGVKNRQIIRNWLVNRLLKTGVAVKKLGEVVGKLGGTLRKLGGEAKKLGAVPRQMGGAFGELGGAIQKMGTTVGKLGAVLRNWGKWSDNWGRTTAPREKPL